MMSLPLTRKATAVFICLAFGSVLMPQLVLGHDVSGDLAFRGVVEPVPLEFEETGGGPKANVSAVLVNQSDRDIELAFTLIDLKGQIEYQPGLAGATSFSVAAPPSIRAGEAKAIAFQIVVPRSSESFDGVIVADDAGGSGYPATLRITGDIAPPGSPLAKATLQPEALTVTVTRSDPVGLLAPEYCWVWPESGGSAFEVRAAGLDDLPDPGPSPSAGATASPTPSPSATASGAPTSSSAPPSIPRPDTNLASETGGRLYAVLQVVNRNASRGLALGLGCAPATGTYSGAIVLDPGSETSPKLGLTVKVQDLFIYPLIVALIGSAIAYVIRMRTDRNRPKKVAERTLEISRIAYRDATVGKDQADAKLLDAVFDREKELPNGVGVAASLVADIGKAKTKEKLDEYADKALALTKMADLYPAIESARRELRSQLTLKLTPVTDAKAIVDEGATLLAVQSLPTFEAADSHLASVRAQVKAGVVWLQSYALFEAARNILNGLPETLPPWISQEVAKVDPRAILETDLKPAATLDDLEKGRVIERMRDSLRVLEMAKARTDKPTRGVSRDTGEEGAFVTFDTADIVLPEFLAPSILDRDMALIKLGDRAEFLVVAVISAAAFLGTSYAGKAFGTPWDYLAAFVAGALGTLAINFTLLPWYRSYRLKASSSSAPSK